KPRPWKWQRAGALTGERPARVGCYVTCYVAGPFPPAFDLFSGRQQRENPGETRWFRPGFGADCRRSVHLENSVHPDGVLDVGGVVRRRGRRLVREGSTA